MKNINIAMLGSGYVAGLYMEGLANVNGQTVRANYSRSAQRAREFGERWQVPVNSTNLHEVIARDDIDLYVIAMPNQEHLPVALKLASAGRNQVCSKPLARDRSEAKRMVAAARISAKLNGYAEAEVFAPAIVTAREAVERGSIGRILSLRSRQSTSGPQSSGPWDVAASGGGVLNDLGCHSVSAARYFFGSDDPVVEVMAWGDRLLHHEKTSGEDNALLVLRFASGGVGHCELSWTAQGGLDRRHEIYGSEGSIFTDLTRGAPVVTFTGASAGADAGPIGPLPESAFVLGYQAAMRHFVECVRDGVSPRETYSDGYVVNCILDAGYESMRERRWVKVEY